MVSWDIKVKFYGHSPNVKELTKLAKEEQFSNIERFECLRVDNDGCGIFRIVVNNRGMEQKKFLAEKLED